MRSSVLFLVLGTLVSGCGSDVTQTETDPLGSVWVRRFGRASYAETASLSAVASGGAIVAGRYYGEVDFGGGKLPDANNSYQAYVARFDASGNHVYSRGFGDVYAESATLVSALPDGSAIVVGQFDFTLDLGTGPLQSAGQDDIFVARLDPSGKALWSKRLGGTSYDYAGAVKALPDGGALIFGAGSGPIDLGTGKLEEALSFLVRLDAKGETTWVKRWNDPNSFMGISRILTRSDGSILVGGTFNGSLDLGGPSPFVANNGSAGFIAVYDTAGKYVDATTLREWQASVSLWAMGFSPSGSLIVTGSSQNSATFTSANFLVELDANFEEKSRGSYGGSGYISSGDLAVSPAGSVYLAGTVSGDINFGAGTLTSTNSGYDAYFVKVGADKNVAYQALWGNEQEQHASYVAVDDDGRVYVVGSTIGPTTIADVETTGTGYYEQFLVSLKP